MQDKLNTLLASLASPRLPIIDMSLARVHALLEALGNPQLNIPPVVHIAGTNGKGSTLAFMRACLEQAGYRVHQYTSPHLVRFNERIVVSGEEIRDDQLISILEEIHSKLNDHLITFFEATTIAAFMAFARNPADIVLLETGMGGRLDATNVIEKPAVTIITPVSYDHKEFLGNTLAAIASEKAGIMKHRVCCVLSNQNKSIINVFERSSKDLQAPLFRYGEDWQIQVEAKGFTYSSAKRSLRLPMPNLAGIHQLYNAGTAIAALEQLDDFAVRDDHIRTGITQARWPARLQKLRHGPLVSLLPDGAEMWLDGGHNPDAGVVLAKWAHAQKERPLFVVCGMLKNKDALAFFNPIAPHVMSLYAVPIPHESQSRPAEQLANLAASAGIESFFDVSVERAVERIKKRATTIGNNYRILLCGSLYLAGHILQKNS